MVTFLSLLLYLYSRHITILPLTSYVSLIMYIVYRISKATGESIDVGQPLHFQIVCLQQLQGVINIVGGMP